MDSLVDFVCRRTAMLLDKLGRGTVNITAGTLSGTGILHATAGDGGDAAFIDGGGGGGGRIHVCATTNSFVQTVTVVGGAAAGSAVGGDEGTIVSSTTLRNHSLGQVSDDFREVATSSVTLYRRSQRFRL